MLKPPIVEEVRRQLLRGGFGRDYAERTARELEDHWNDLVDEALRQGQGRIEAEAEANLKIGEPTALAKELAWRMRRTSWLGRHPAFGFAMFALAATILWWALFLFAAGSATGLFGWVRITTGKPWASLNAMMICIDWIRSTSFVAAPWLICFIAQRYYCGWKPALWGCLVIAIHNSMHFFRLTGPPGQGTIAWGYSFSTNGPELLPIFTPIIVFTLFILWRFRDRSQKEHSELQLS